MEYLSFILCIGNKVHYIIDKQIDRKFYKVLLYTMYNMDDLKCSGGYFTLDEEKI